MAIGLWQTAVLSKRFPVSHGLLSPLLFSQRVSFETGSQPPEIHSLRVS